MSGSSGTGADSTTVGEGGGDSLLACLASRAEAAVVLGGKGWSEEESPTLGTTAWNLVSAHTIVSATASTSPSATHVDLCFTTFSDGQGGLRTTSTLTPLATNFAELTSCPFANKCAV